MDRYKPISYALALILLIFCWIHIISCDQEKESKAETQNETQPNNQLGDPLKINETDAQTISLADFRSVLSQSHAILTTPKIKFDDLKFAFTLRAKGSNGKEANKEYVVDYFPSIYFRPLSMYVYSDTLKNPDNLVYVKEDIPYESTNWGIPTTELSVARFNINVVPLPFLLCALSEADYDKVYLYCNNIVYNKVLNDDTLDEVGYYIPIRAKYCYADVADDKKILLNEEISYYLESNQQYVTLYSLEYIYNNNSGVFPTEILINPPVYGKSGDDTILSKEPGIERCEWILKTEPVPINVKEYVNGELFISHATKNIEFTGSAFWKPYSNDRLLDELNNEEIIELWITDVRVIEGE